MKLGTQEHYDLMQAFERDHSGMRLDRENKDLWPKGHVYQNGETNSLFLAFRNGYAFCECVKRPAAIEALSAQSAQPQAGEPVAWQWRERAVYKTSGRKGEWSDWTEGKAPFLRVANYEAEERPLYAAPQPALAVKESDSHNESNGVE